jgi:hypothetical protein
MQSPKGSCYQSKGPRPAAAPNFDAAIIHDGWLKTQLRSFMHGQQRVAEIGTWPSNQALHARRGLHSAWGGRPQCLDLCKGLAGGVQNGV